MGRTKNNGIDLAREIISMTRQYNEVIAARNGEIRALEQEVRYYKHREESAVKSIDELRRDLEIEIEKLRGTLETVTDIICSHLKKHENQVYIESLWNWEKDFGTIIAALDIEIQTQETEKEKKENEN